MTSKWKLLSLHGSGKNGVVAVQNSSLSLSGIPHNLPGLEGNLSLRWLVSTLAIIPKPI